jgi:hypothetical protein
MSGKNNFAALKQYATKEYKFKQGRSIGELDPSGTSVATGKLTADQFGQIKGGICAALAASWLKEKLTSAKHPAFSGHSAGPDVHAGRNLDTVRSAVPKFLAYKKAPFASEILAAYDLEPSPGTAAFNPIQNEKVPTTEKWRDDRTGKVVEKKTIRTVPKVAESLANACTAELLKQGRGVYISLRVVGKTPDKPGGGHAVAAYRSRGNKLHFFDPNCGVYDVTDPGNFFAAFVACYEGVGYDLALDTAKDSFAYVDR